jgi:drug/metabolite transporter (DMT)-like permease
VALLGHFALGEKITPLRWAGILVICCGVLIVGHTPPRTTQDAVESTMQPVAGQITSERGS